LNHLHRIVALLFLVRGTDSRRRGKERFERFLPTTVANLGERRFVGGVVVVVWYHFVVVRDEFFL
jgi:hypothetical protein